MEAYVVTMMDLDDSVKSATNTVISGRAFNQEVEMYPATVVKSEQDAFKECLKHDLPYPDYNRYKRYLPPHNPSESGWGVIGNFISQYTLWKYCSEMGEPIMILEHDSVFVDEVPLPGTNVTSGIINIGKPSYGSYKLPSAADRSMWIDYYTYSPGFGLGSRSELYSLFSKPGGYFPGAHGYVITPNMALSATEVAKQIGPCPVDLFFNKILFGNILSELYPWPVECQDSFTTIQNERGCRAKHNFHNSTYRIIGENNGG